jgi:hypothetical protein
MSGLLESDDLRKIASRRELYRRYARLCDSIEELRTVSGTPWSTAHDGAARNGE